MSHPTPPSVDLLAIKAVLLAVRQAADAICDRWSFEILLAAFEGETRFTGFAERTGMASRLVASRLSTLEQLGVFSREGFGAQATRKAYRLTPMGEALAEVIRQMIAWEYRWRPHEPSPAQLTGHLVGAEQATLLCGHCGAPTTARDVAPRLDEARVMPLPTKQSVYRRSTLVAADADEIRPLGESLAIFGDKWGIEVLICSFFRVRRFGDFRACTGISANILSDRLSRLEALGILAPARDQTSTPGYWLTEKGVDLYGVMIAVQAWADGWLPARTRSPVRLFHIVCGQAI